MNLFSFGKNRRVGKKKSVRKPKIRWQLLGLTAPTSSIETIRREVSSLARHGFWTEYPLRRPGEQIAR